jgi:EAL domain-containing protein (putative c-di-GMP-specific phosphodiesterase class I)
MIRTVLSDCALETVFQPVVALPDGRRVGYEALTRFPTWPQRGTEVFFVEATRLGLGLELESAAVESACRYLDDLDPDTWLSLNISPQHLLSSRMAALLESAPPDRVVIELTEHASVSDYDALSARLAELRSGGFRIAVDDAGAGFSSLRHILRVQPEFIKLDIGLCRGIATDPARAAMARALVSFAAETGSAVVAEGIENGRDLAALRELGVHLGQGYFLGRPESLRSSMPAS